jgi:hypothetical protein
VPCRTSALSPTLLQWENQRSMHYTYGMLIGVEGNRSALTPLFAAREQLVVPTLSIDWLRTKG